MTALMPRLAPCLTAASTLLAIALFSWSLHRVTDKLTAWTFDERRANAVARGELRAPVSLLRDAQDRARLAFAADAPDSAPGDVWLVDFVYTRCPSVCQALGAEFFRMQERLLAAGAVHADLDGNEVEGRRRGRLRLLSISIDPEHDTPEALRAYGERHRADARVWTLASPVDAREGQALMRRLGVIAVPDGLGGFVHNAGLHLIEADGRLREVAGLGEWEAVFDRARRIVDADACQPAR